MVATVNAIGSLTSIIGTELTVNREYVTDAIDNKWFSYWLSFENMQNGDIVELRQKTRVQTGGALVTYKLEVLTDIQSEPVWYSATLPNDNGLAITIKQTAGSPRTFYYRIYEI